MEALRYFGITISTYQKQLKIVWACLKIKVIIPFYFLNKCKLIYRGKNK